MSRLTASIATSAITAVAFMGQAQAEVPLASGGGIFSSDGALTGQSYRRHRRSRRRPRVTHRVVHSQAQVPGAGVVFGQVGAGTVANADTYETPMALGAGFRYEIGNAAVEIAGRAVFSDDVYGQNNLSSTQLRLMGQYMLNGGSMASPYFGAGMGVSSVSMDADGLGYEGEGLSAELAAGLSFLRDSPVRLNVEAAASLPFYRLDRGIHAAAFEDDTVYAPTFSLNLGLGFQVF